MMEQLNELLNLSPPVGLLVFLFFLGVILKKADIFPNRFIPLTQLLLGAGIYPFLAAVVPNGYYYPLAAKVFLGGLIGAGTVALHQVIKQYLEKKGLKLNGEDTDFVSKSTEKPNEEKPPNPPTGSGSNPPAG